MKGVVAAGHPLTAQAGADVLRAGGNALDAAIAAMLMSWVAESPLTGPGAAHLRIGDLVSGPARAPERGERYPALVHVDLINGAEPEEGAERPRLEDLTAVPARRRLRLEPDSADILTRAVDLLVPLSDSACSCGRRRDRDERRCSAASPARSSALRSGPPSSSC